MAFDLNYYLNYTKTNISDIDIQELSDVYSNQYASAVSKFDIIIASDRADTIYKNSISYKCIADYTGQWSKSEIKNVFVRQIWTKHSDNFKSGDLVEFENKTSKEKKWYLFLKCVETKEGYDLSVMQECNNLLKWYNENGKLIKLPCIFSNKSIATDFDYNANINLLDGRIRVSTQYNADSLKIKENKRFLFNGQAYKVTYINNHDQSDVNNSNSVTLVTFDMVIDNLSPDDDKQNNIANAQQYNYSLTINQSNIQQSVGYTSQLTYTLTLNDVQSTNFVEWVSNDETICTVDNNGNIELLAEGECVVTCRMISNNLVSDSINIEVVAIPIVEKVNKITPEIYSINQNQTQVYEVKQLENNVDNGSGFNFSCSGASASKYVFTKINDNQFSVLSKGYDSNKLVVSCVNLVDGSNVSIQMQLKNLW